MSFQQLPYEILENIFETVYHASGAKKYISNFALVCKAWYAPACCVLFQMLKVRDISQLLKHLIHQKNNLAIYCKVLCFSDFQGGVERPCEEYKKLLSYLPNIRTIILESSPLRIHHLSQLAQHSELIKYVKKIFLEGKWRLEESQYFYHCSIAFKNTLQHIALDSLGETITSIDGRSGNMIDFLPEFTALTSLRIANRNNNYTPKLPQLSMFKVMRLCPNLISFTLKNSFKEPEDSDTIHTFDHGKLKYLKLSLPQITKQHISYMAANITQLNVFKLKCEYTTNTSEPILWTERLKSDTLNRFHKYMASIKRVDFELKGNFKTKLFNYWPFLGRIIINDRSTPTHIRLGIKGRDYREILLMKHEDIIYIDCIMDMRDFQSTTNLSTSPLLLKKFIAPLELSENNVQTLHIDFGSARGDPVLKDYRFSILQSITSTFNHLKYLNTNIVYASLTQPFLIAITSMETPRNEIIAYNYCRAKYLQSRFVLPSDVLAHASLQCLESAEEITSVITFFPNVKVLRLLHSNFNEDNNFNITMDLRNLKLQLLGIEFTDIVYRGRGRRTFVLEIEENGSNQTSCFKCEIHKRRMTQMTFERVEASFLRGSGRLTSREFPAILIKCHTLKLIELYTKHEQRYGSFTTKVFLDRNT